MHFPFAGCGDDRDMTHPDLRSPPRFVIAIPANRALESFFEVELRLPVDQFLEFRSVSSMSKNLPGTAADKLYLTVAWPHRFQNSFRDFQHTAMSLSADVDDLPTYFGDVGVNQSVQCLAMIFDIQPVSGHLAIAVHGQ